MLSLNTTTTYSVRVLPAILPNHDKFFTWLWAAVWCLALGWPSARVCPVRPPLLSLAALGTAPAAFLFLLHWLRTDTFAFQSWVAFLPPLYLFGHFGPFKINCVSHSTKSFSLAWCGASPNSLRARTRYLTYHCWAPLFLHTHVARNASVALSPVLSEYTGLPMWRIALLSCSILMATSLLHIAALFWAATWLVFAI